MACSPPRFWRVAPPGVVDNDLSHRDRANGEEVPAIAPRGPGLVHQPQVGFVDEPARVQRLDDAAAPAELDAGQPPQVVVDQRYEPVQGARIAGTMGDEQLGDFSRQVPFRSVAGLPGESRVPSGGPF